MTLKLKILFVVLPLLISSIILLGGSSYFSAVSGVSKAITELLSFKAYELERYMKGQWSLLLDNGYSQRPDMVQAMQAGVLAFAQSLKRNSSELILALDSNKQIAMQTADVSLKSGEVEVLVERIKHLSPELIVMIDGVERVYQGFYFEPFGWTVLLTEEKSSFYSDVDKITLYTALFLIVLVIMSTILLFVFVNIISRPLKKVVKDMRSIIESGDLNQSVEVEFQDEIGELSHTFNLMTIELNKAYGQIKRFAFEAVLAQKKENRIRNIFQKYVPKELIEQFFQNPESMLVGENRELAIFFSDIRSFTSLSESMAPDDLVASLNRYFDTMVDIIMHHGGLVDKYIGDAIMAFFGAPIKHENYELSSVLSALEVIEALKTFNKHQVEIGKPEFQIGIGLNHGLVLIGNIGCQKKMDYTVIGDAVNLASRLEGLTKLYHCELIFAHSLYEKVKDHFFVRLLDAVAVKGKTQGVRIYTAAKSLNKASELGWKWHNEGMDLYFNRQFSEACEKFRQVQKTLPEDWVSSLMLKRCLDYEKHHPGQDWNGVETIKTK